MQTAPEPRAENGAAAQARAPNSPLDPISQQETMAIVHDACAETGCAVLLVTHDQALARAMSDRVIALGGAPNA